MPPDDPTQEPRPTAAASPRREPGRRLAIAALVLALVPCCPLTGLAGAMLGAFALRAVRLAGDAGATRGPAASRTRRLAFIAMGIGALSALVWSATLDWVARAQDAARERTMIQQVGVFVEAAERGDDAAALDAWSASDAARPDAGTVAAFGRSAQERYGDFDRFSVISTARSGSLLAPVVEVAGVLHFDEGSPLGSARFSLRPGGLVPAFDLTHLSIEDRVRGDLSLGAVTNTATDAATDTATDASN